MKGIGADASLVSGDFPVDDRYCLDKEKGPVFFMKTGPIRLSWRIRILEAGEAHSWWWSTPDRIDHLHGVLEGAFADHE